MTTPEFRTLDAGEVRLHAAVHGEGPLVLMVHGFPESWYSWRHQIPAIAEAGFTACAIDVRGYGGSDKPWPVADYGMDHMVSDLVGAAEAMAPGQPAILLGHDWGAPMVWNAALAHPDRFRAVAALSVPWPGVGDRPFSAVYDELFTRKGRFFYQQYFQEEGVGEAEAEADVAGFLRRFYYAISGEGAATWPTDKALGDPLLKGLIDPDRFPPWMTAADLDFYTSEFERSGLRGPLNRYRNHERDWEWQQTVQGPQYRTARLVHRRRPRPRFQHDGRRRSCRAHAPARSEPPGRARPTGLWTLDTARAASRGECAADTVVEVAAGRSWRQ